MIARFDSTVDSGPVITVNTIALTIAIIGYLILHIGIGLYYPSISYEITDEEILVHRGLITKTNKIVPFRTVTNIDVKKGPFDRLFGIGTIEIQTAGYSASKSGPEERIDGMPLDKVDEIQQQIVKKVRMVKGSAATSHDVDGDDVVRMMLYEIQELKEILKRKE